MSNEMDWEALPETTARGFTVAVRGFANEQAAQSLGGAVKGAIELFGSFMDLTGLEGVTIGADYDEALASVDLGSASLPALGRTDTDDLQGVAKSCRVLRDGTVRSHLIFNAAVLAPLITPEAEPTTEGVQTAIGIIAHECAHVALHKLMEERVPDARWNAVIPDYRRAVLFQIAEICWEEYAACRMSAQFAPQQNAEHVLTTITSLRSPRPEARAAIRAYRFHGDLSRLLKDAAGALCQPMKAASYLLGGLDAGGQPWAELTEVRDAAEASDYTQLIGAMHAELQHLWDSQSQWSETSDVFAPLREVFADVLASEGLRLTPAADGQCRIDVPLWAGAQA